MIKSIRSKHVILSFMKRIMRPSPFKLTLYLTLFISIPGFAENMPMKPIEFNLNMDKDIKFIPWYKDTNNYVINFNGVTKNEEAPDEKLYKLDLTFNSNGRIYLGIPVSIPVESEVKTNWTYKFGPESSKDTPCNFGFGINFIPCFNNYVFRSLEFNPAEAKWETKEINNVFDHCKNNAAPIIAQKYYNDVTPSELSPNISYITIFLKGKKGTRIVLYIKDITIKSNAPSEADMKKLIAERWEPVKKKVAVKLQGWRKQLQDTQEQLNTVTISTELVKKMKDQISSNINTISKLCDSIEKSGIIQIKKEQEIISNIKELSAVNCKKIDEFLLREKNNLFIPYVLNPINDKKILPDDLYLSSNCSTNIELNSTAGEFIPASFLIRTLSDLSGVRPVPTDLNNEVNGKTIPASDIDIKVVKCWYQAGTAWVSTEQRRDEKAMVPELLLNDEKLVKVDKEKKDNYLRFSFPDNEKYIWISDPNEKSDGPYKLISCKDFPVKDSTVLLPVDIPNNTNQQFWITVKIPADAAPGTYSGKINITQKDKTIGFFNIKLNVLPFKLSEPYYTSSIYYRGQISDKYSNGTISSEYKSETQLQAEFKNLFEHGIRNPICYQPFNDKNALDKYFTTRVQNGMHSKDLYYCYGLDVECSDTPESKNKLNQRISEVLEYLKKYSITEVYFYGRDEAKGERLIGQRRAWDIIHNAGAKVFVAGYANENFEKMGDIQDLLICAYAVMKEEARKWHSKGHKIWSYANPQGGVENPAVYRQNFGILLWQKDYDGACTFAYQQSYGNIWNDFDGHYRDEVFTYPTVDGVINTIAWEGYREGVNDVRYLTTLIKEIEKTRKDNKPAKQNAIANAEKYLSELKNTDIMNLDLDNMRLKMAEYIMELQK